VPSINGFRFQRNAVNVSRIWEIVCSDARVFLLFYDAVGS
jgi:hypothetical protein